MEYVLCAITALTGIAVILIIRGIWEIHRFVIKEYEITSKKLEGNEKRMVVLSDLHDRSYGRNNDKLLGAIDNIAPDCIIIAGDMIVGNDKTDHTKTVGFIARLASKYPVYYGPGNHESRYGAYLRYKEDISNDISKKAGSMDASGIYFLENNLISFDDNIMIYGAEIAGEYYTKGRKREMPHGYVEEILGKPDIGKYNILIAHNPEYFDSYVEFGADLILSGHNHGGTVRLPGIGGIISTKYTLFPKYDKGVFKKNNSTMIVSGGMGSHTINFRLFNVPELILIKLKA